MKKLLCIAALFISAHSVGMDEKIPDFLKSRESFTKTLEEKYNESHPEAQSCIKLSKNTKLFEKQKNIRQALKLQPHNRANASDELVTEIEFNLLKTHFSLSLITLKSILEKIANPE